MTANFDLIVVGAGPAGSCTATLAARAGARVLLLDRATFPRPKPCAEYLSPQASRILERLGALSLVEGAGAAHLAGMLVRAPGGASARGEFAAAHGFRGFRDEGLALRRTILDTILLERARDAGAEVREGLHVADVVRDRRGRVTGVRTTGEGAGEIRARIVVGADGLRSVVARRLGLTHRARWPRRLALVAHYRGVHGMDGVGEMHVERDGYVGLADVGDGLTNVAMVVPAARAAGMGGDPTGFMERWLATRPQLAPRFAGAVREGAVRATGPFAVHAARATAPGAALVGDAADFFDPFTGEGIYAALRGGELLADALAAHDAFLSPHRADRALAAYEASRRREFRGKWAVERIIGSVVASPLAMNRAIGALGRRKDMIDLLVGVTGDFVPARKVLHPWWLLRLVGGALRPGATPPRG
ncbi:MAG TPA: FAD-dependent monooxygenase [Gemmatimonadaceae bacterium]